MNHASISAAPVPNVRGYHCRIHPDSIVFERYGYRLQGEVPEMTTLMGPRQHLEVLNHPIYGL